MNNYQIVNKGPYFSIITNNEGEFAGIISAFPNALICINLVGGMAHVGFASMTEAQAFIHAL